MVRRCSGSMSTAMSGAIASAASSVTWRIVSAELVVAAGAAAVQELELVVVLGHPAEVGLEPALGLRSAVGRVGGGLGDRREQAVADLVEQRPVELALGVEVLVQHGFGDPGGVGDVVHRRAVVAGAAEHLERDVEDLFPARGRGQTGVGERGRLDMVLPEGNRSRSEVTESVPVLEIVPFGRLDRVAEDDRGHQEHERHDHRHDDERRHRRREPDRERDHEQCDREREQQVADPVGEQRPPSRSVPDGRGTRGRTVRCERRGASRAQTACVRGSAGGGG